MKMAFGEMLIRYRWERPDGYLVYPSESTKIQLYISCVNKLGVFKWQEYCKVAKKDVSKLSKTANDGRSVMETQRKQAHS